MSRATRLPEPLDTSRNWGFVSDELQEVLAQSTVAIAGVGGVGGRIAVELTRLGVGSITLADPDIFTPTNLNRQEGSCVSTLNQSKAEVIAALCRDINPRVQVRVFTDGVTVDNLTDFLAAADILVEATDFSLPHLGVMLARAARAQSIPMLTGAEVGFGAILTWFRPAGYTYERHLGLRHDVTLGELESGATVVDITRWLPHIPSYGDLEVLKQVAAGDKPAPAISPAVGLSSAMASTLIVNILNGSGAMRSAPAIYSVDVKELRSRVIRYPRLHHKMSLLRVIVRTLLSR